MKQKNYEKPTMKAYELQQKCRILEDSLSARVYRHSYVEEDKAPVDLDSEWTE